MDIEIYAVKDKKSGWFMNPFPSRGVTDAIRSIREVTQDEKSFLHKYPMDYSLWLIAKMEDTSGKVKTEEVLPDGTEVWKGPLFITEIESLHPNREK